MKFNKSVGIVCALLGLLFDSSLLQLKNSLPKVLIASSCRRSLVSVILGRSGLGLQVFDGEALSVWSCHLVPPNCQHLSLPMIWIRCAHVFSWGGVNLSWCLSLNFCTTASLLLDYFGWGFGADLNGPLPLVPLLPRPISCSTGCIASLACGNVWCYMLHSNLNSAEFVWPESDWPANSCYVSCTADTFQWPHRLRSDPSTYARISRAA